MVCNSYRLFGSDTLRERYVGSTLKGKTRVCLGNTEKMRDCQWNLNTYEVFE